MRTDTPAEFDAYDRNYNEVVDKALSFSGLTVDFFTRVKADYFLELLASASPAKLPDVIDIGCGIANSHPLLAGHVGSSGRSRRFKHLHRRSGCPQSPK